MNLGKLLNASTSFFRGGEKAPYHLSKGPCLPKFNEGKNPFGYKAGEPAPAPAPEPVKAEPKAAVQKAPPPYAFKPAASTKVGDVRRQTVATPVQEKPAKQGWTTRLNPFRGTEPQPQPSQPQTRVVQAELSLDAVKVVHNDLADADVEVVPMKSRSDVVTPPVLPPARRAWEYLGESLMKST